MYNMGDFNEDEKPLKNWLWEVIFDARLAAIENKTRVTLRFNEEERQFVIRGEGVSLSKAPPPNHDGDFEVNFYPLMPDETTGSFKAEYADDNAKEMVFGPSGVSTPLRLEVIHDGETLELYPDVFSSYFVEDEDG